LIGGNDDCRNVHYKAEGAWPSAMIFRNYERGDSMIIQFVRFKSELAMEEAEKVMKKRQKFYGVHKETGEFAGIYFWDSEESIREFRQSELARTIASQYKAEGSPRIDLFDVMYTLRS